MITNTWRGYFPNPLSFNDLKKIILVTVIIALMTLSLLMMAAREKGESFITLRVKVEVQMMGRT